MASINRKAASAEANAKKTLAAEQAAEAKAKKAERARIAAEKKGLDRMRFHAEELEAPAWAALERVLLDEDAPGATIIKAAQVVFERLYGKTREYSDDDEQKDKGTTTTLRLVGAPLDE